MNIKAIIRKYFELIGFCKDYDSFFPLLSRAAEMYDIPSLTNDKLREIGDPVLNLARLLFKCEELSKKYNELGIEYSIFLDTVSDIKIWADTYFKTHGEQLGLGEINWLLYHTEFRLFRLGRLQFAFGSAEADINEKGLCRGDDIIEVHIPEGSPLTKEECTASFNAADIFFKKYFPEYKYRFYTCHSWLLDANLKKLLKSGSNILKFAELFDIVSSNESYAAVKYIFGWNETKESAIEKDYPDGSFKKKMQEYLASGGALEESYGIIKR